jgi:hypothetical protein
MSTRTTSRLNRRNFIGAATGVASGSVMAPCMAMGEAAGHAAMQVVSKSTPFAAVDTAKLRRDLAAHDAVVDWQ